MIKAFNTGIKKDLAICKAALDTQWNNDNKENNFGLSSNTTFLFVIATKDLININNDNHNELDNEQFKYINALIASNYIFQVFCNVFFALM